MIGFDLSVSANLVIMIINTMIIRFNLSYFSFFIVDFVHLHCIVLNFLSKNEKTKHIY